ncbi:mannitol dehydrogenase family protein [Hamadaea tsunoensis]|uniref:mannitol dehydrogenase family protein n=1 Tax=Hamadaea tsunoensis TaxID=53368 RepID=UPI0004070EE7|nr:mannitol dehydrogenase family protein [Hamadaea tsunoensis]
MELSPATLKDVPAGARPAARPERAGIVHLGLGAFHRAHQAVYTDDLHAGGLYADDLHAGGSQGEGGWGIIGVAPRSESVAGAMIRQGGLFSVNTLGPDATTTRVVGSIIEVLHAPSDPAAVTRALADPAIRVVTLTVTEKAYRSGSAAMTLLLDGLRQRPAGAPLAIVSCDNLPSNGHRLRAVVEAEFEIPDDITFPCTAVDRIVPASTADTYERAARALGVRDAAAVDAEPYKQWVIQDDFPGGRPAWDAAGAVFTDDVAPWERLKLRTLNGVHSALAYLGALAGCETIAEALALPGMAELMRGYIAAEIAPSFTPPPGVDVVAYGESVLERFANPAIRHRTLQVAMDGTQKLPQRVLGTIMDTRAHGGEPRLGALIIAAWTRFARGYADDGAALPLDDPLAQPIRALADGRPDRLIEGLTEVFPAAVRDDEPTRALIRTWYADLERHGVAAVVRGQR